MNRKPYRSDEELPVQNGSLDMNIKIRKLLINVTALISLGLYFLIPPVVYAGDIENTKRFSASISKPTMVLTEEENIKARWLNGQFEKQIDYSVILKFLLGAFVLFTVFSYWNRQLKVAKEAAEASGLMRYQMQKNLQGLVDQRTSELEKSERLYHGLMDASPDAVVVVNEEGIIELHNDKAEKLFGYSDEELHGQSIEILIPKDDTHHLKNTASFDVFNMSGNVIAKRKNGTEFSVDISCSPMQTDNGIMTILDIRDVSEREQVEKVLQTIAQGTSIYTGKEFFQALVKQLAGTLGVRYAFVGELADEEQRVIRSLAVWAGESAAGNFEYQLRGTPCDNVLGKETCIYPRDVQHLFPSDQMLIDMGVESYAGAPLFNSNGEPLGIIVVLDDKPLADELIIRSVISNFAVRAGVELERSRTEIKLRQTAAIFDNSDEGFVITDAKNNILATNRAFSEITGYSEEEAVGKNPRFLQSGKQDKHFYSTMWHSITTTGKWQGEIWNQRKNGEFYPVWLTISLIRDEKGNIINHVAVSSDISKRVQAEEKQHELQRQLQHIQKMESIGQLTGGIAHDFNNMLSSIMGYTDLARMLAIQDKSSQLTEYLDQVSRASERARDLVAQMLIFSRGSDKDEKITLPLGPVVKEAVKMLRPILPSSIEINVSVNDDLPVVKADQVQLHQLIMNLCINARDAMSDKGQIDVKLSVTSGADKKCNSCHQHVSGDYVEIVVSDSGAGIKPSAIERLFEPFFTTKEVGKGTGMGLAMVHGIMHDHSGHIIVNSTPGEGTEFHLLFPFIKDEVKEEKEQDDLKIDLIEGEYQHILIVDDEESIAKFMKVLLERYKYRVSIFTDSVEALTFFKMNPDKYDLVITDQTMPIVTGEEMARSMLKTRPDLPIILCSGYSSRIDKENAENIGIKAYMQKPMNTKDILQTVNALLVH